MLIAINATKVEDTFKKKGSKRQIYYGLLHKKKVCSKITQQMFRFHCCFISFLQMNRIKLMGIAIDDVIKMNLRTRFWKRIYTSEADKTSRVK